MCSIIKNILLTITFVPVTLFAMEKPLTHLAIFVSGRGTNMEAILAKKIDHVKPCVVISSKQDAFALTKAADYEIPAVYINPNAGNYTGELIDCLKKYEVTPENGLICLAGFMKILDAKFVSYFENKILNVHPSLLPAFTGLIPIKRALAYGVKVSGCTVHFVDDGIDTGAIIKQAVVEVKEDDTEESLTERILEQEHKIYPEAIELFVQNKIIIEGRKAKIIS